MEAMSDDQLRGVIRTGSFGSDNAPAVRSAPAGSRASSSPAQLSQMALLQGECERLREQLSLVQNQLAKAVSQLDLLKSDGKVTVKKKGFSRGRSSASNVTAAAAAAGSPPVAEDMSATVLQETTRRLDEERTRAATYQAELVKIRAITQSKLDERLNEMARRLNLANQTNEERYRNAMLDMETMKQQLAMAKKAFVRKLEDQQLAHKEALQRVEDRAVALVQQQRAMVAEVDAARSANAEVRALRTRLEQAQSDSGPLRERNAELEAQLAACRKELGEKELLVRRSADALVGLRDKMMKLQQILVANAQQSAMESAVTESAPEKVVDRLEERLLAYEAALKVRDAELASLRSSGVANGGAAVVTAAQHERRRPSATPPPPSESGAAASSPTASPSPLAAASAAADAEEGGDEVRVRRAATLLTGAASRRGSTTVSLEPPPSADVSDLRWLEWSTDPYVYDPWSVLEGSVDTRSPAQLIVAARAHNLEVGRVDVPPPGDPLHSVFVEPLDRELFYQKHLAHSPHVHLLGAAKNGEHLVVTVEAASDRNRGAPLLALLHTKSKTLRAVLNMEQVVLPSKVLELSALLDESFAGCNLRRIDDGPTHDLISQRLVEFENMHLDFNRRVGILYWKSGQTENEAFGNNMSPQLDEFLQFFGQRIRLKGWSKFRGGLNVTNDETGAESVYAEFGDFCFMAHVSALLPYREQDEQKLDRKRHIGNDLVVIIFWEGPGSFDPSQLVTQMCHVFIVIERVPSTSAGVPRYRVGVVCRSGVQPFRPYLTSEPVFDATDAFRSWLFMKIINGERSTFQAKTFVTKTSTARKTLLAKLCMDAMAQVEDALSLSSPWALHKFAVSAVLASAHRVKVVQAFTGTKPQELTLRKGEELTLFCRPSDTWWNGANAGNRRGDFPSARVVPVEKKEKRKWGKRGAEVAKAQPLSASATQLTPAGGPQHDFSHELEVVLVRGTGLASKDVNGLSDPYVKMWVVTATGILQGSEYVSQKQFKTLNPEWNERITVKV